MRVTITAIRRYGTLYAVSLSCGHKYSATADQIKADQLYIGKHVECMEHIERTQ